MAWNALVQGFLTSHICNNCKAFIYGKYIFQSNQNRKLHIQAGHRSWYIYILLFIYFLETKLAIFTKNKSLTGFWPRWISLNCLPITEMFRHNNLRQKCLPKPLNIKPWTYSTLEVIQHPLLLKYFIYIKEALKGIARHSQYKQVSNELFFISHHLNEIDLLCYSFSK